MSKWLVHEYVAKREENNDSNSAPQFYTKDKKGQYVLWKEDRPLLTRVISFLNFLKK